MTAEGTVPTVGTRAYIDTGLSFEKDPADLGEPGSLDDDTHQTLTAREKAVFSSKRLKHLILWTVGGKTLRRVLFRLLQSTCKCIS